MTNKFIPTLARQPLYCLWIKTGNPKHPLDRVWIDPELRSFQFYDVNSAAPIRATNNECEPEAGAERSPVKGRLARELLVTPFRREELKVKTMKRLSWVVAVLWFFLNTAWADVAGRVSGMVSDPS